MSAMDDLLCQVNDQALRKRLEKEFARLNKNKKFGLVFEERKPECTPLYGAPIRKGSIVAKKSGQTIDLYTVLKINGNIAQCLHKASSKIEELPVSELVSVAQFGDPIFPFLIPVAKIENSKDGDLWHTLIEAENYHALLLFEYLYPKQVDCIYIDPPYNSGARDWKYNNDYVDISDSWRHSKWLAMMQKRLKIAKRLLNPDTGVLIVTVDENEVHHLRMLLEEILPETYIQMVTIVINPKGVSQGRFSRLEEYAIFCFMPNAYVTHGNDPLLGEKRVSKKPRWKGLLRSGSRASREHTPNEFYPILIDADNRRVVKALAPLPPHEKPDLATKIDGYDVAWPIRSDNSEGLWGVTSPTLNALIAKGYVSLGRYDPTRKTWAMSYLTLGPQKQIESGELIIVNYDQKRNVVEVEYAKAQEKQIRTVWHRTLHDAGAHGSDLVTNIIGRAGAFSFPKSIYSTKDAIASVVRNNKNALIVDFFAGSGTTLHSVNLLNAEDGGQRRCILVTNNEVSEATAKELLKQGYSPGDPQWEKHGICQSVTWPRTKYSIWGRRDDGTTLEGEYFINKTTRREENRLYYQLGFVENPSMLSTSAKKQIVALLGKSKLPQSLVRANSKYIVSEKYPTSILFDCRYGAEYIKALKDQNHITEFYIVTNEPSIFNKIKGQITDLLGSMNVFMDLKRPMSDGFLANVEYFRLGFLDKHSISLGQQFRKILPLLWLKSGSLGRRPELSNFDENIPDMLMLPQNGFAILIDETKFTAFANAIADMDSIKAVYFVTDSEGAFREMSAGVKKQTTYQLYRDYIDNFVIGSRRNFICPHC